MSSANTPVASVSVGRVLVVSNDVATIKQVSESLRQFAMSPETCSEVHVALERLDRQKFDSVIVDFRLGDQAMTILEKAHASRSNRTAVRFAISGSDEATAAAFKGGANFVLRRPLSFTTIDRTLRAAYGLIVREQRRYFRCSIGVVARLGLEGADIDCESVNISEGGMAVRTAVAFKTGARVQVQFTLPEIDSAFSVESTICWRRDGVVGLQFTSLSATQTAELQEWLARRLEESFPEFVAAKFRKLGTHPQVSEELNDATAFVAVEAGHLSQWATV